MKFSFLHITKLPQHMCTVEQSKQLVKAEAYNVVSFRIVQICVMIHHQVCMYRIVVIDLCV